MLLRTVAWLELPRPGARCQPFGIGSVRVTPDPDAPNYVARLRAVAHPPDMSDANRFADDVKRHDPREFVARFG